MRHGLSFCHYKKQYLEKWSVLSPSSLAIDRFMKYFYKYFYLETTHFVFVANIDLCNLFFNILIIVNRNVIYNFVCN